MRIAIIFVAVMLAGCTSYQAPNPYTGKRDGITEMSFDEAWETAIAFFANAGIPLKNVEKESGLIAAEYGLGAGESMLDCGESGTYDLVQLRTADINVLMRDLDTGATAVRVNVFGRASVFNTMSKVSTPYRCESSGEIEKLVLDSVGAR